MDCGVIGRENCETKVAGCVCILCASGYAWVKFGFRAVQSISKGKE